MISLALQTTTIDFAHTYWREHSNTNVWVCYFLCNIIVMLTHVQFTSLYIPCM